MVRSCCLAVTLWLIPGLAAAAPVDAIRSGDMTRMIPEIIALYEGAGLSWDHGIDWTIGPFTTTYWYYAFAEDEIVVGAVPRDGEVDAYWQTWSEVLTDGHFDPGGFFASATEARELARYNQFVLATHESAHAMTYRYDYGHLQRHDYAINCREYYADRLTVAMLNDQAARDPDMARWRDRYRALVTAMGATIPEQYRYHIADFATLDADCAVIDVAQPTPQTMQPYASAYFERYRVLLEAELPPLREVFAAHLQRHLEAALAELPIDPDRARYGLATLPGTIPGVVAGEGRGDELRYSRAAAFAPDGTIYFATLGYDPDTRRLELVFGTDPAATVSLAPATTWHRPSMRLELASLAVLSSDRFLMALEHWEYVQGSAEDDVNVVSWALAERRNGVWAIEHFGALEDMRTAAVLRGPSGRIYLLASPDRSSALTRSRAWSVLEVDPATFDVIGTIEPRNGLGHPLAIDAEQGLLEAGTNDIWRSRLRRGAAALFVGNPLGGVRDGPLTSAELVSPQAMQWLADGTALILDNTPGYDDWIIRRLAPLPGQ